MEDLDVFAATCAYMHCGTATTSGEKLMIVTAAVDRIDMHMRLDEPLNLRMKGMVTFVGRSSMEVTILIESSAGPIDPDTSTEAYTEQPGVSQTRTNRDPTIEQLASTFSADDSMPANGLWKPAAVAKFIMVARDAMGPVEVPRIRLTSEREEAIFAAGEQRNCARLERTQQSLFKEPPTAAESVLLHRLFLSSTGSSSASQALSIAATALTTTKLCHPQERNIHNLIFGGYLMREAFELGYTCAQMFARAGELQFLAVDELAFKHPVPIGALLQLSAHVVYTQEEQLSSLESDQTASSQQTSNEPARLAQMIHVEVVADVVNITSHDRKTTNTFHFTFRLDPTAPHHPGSLRTVRPSTYVEAMRYLEGKRRLSAARLDPNSQIYKF
jgi:acyl-coenzyme A thioesterase 9